MHTKITNFTHSGDSLKNYFLNLSLIVNSKQIKLPLNLFNFLVLNPQSSLTFFPAIEQSWETGLNGQKIVKCWKSI